MRGVSIGSDPVLEAPEPSIHPDVHRLLGTEIRVFRDALAFWSVPPRSVRLGG
jgi:hypothetical protein